MQNLSIISAAYGSKTACINTHVIKNPSYRGSAIYVRKYFFGVSITSIQRHDEKHHSFDKWVGKSFDSCSGLGGAKYSRLTTTDNIWAISCMRASAVIASALWVLSGMIGFLYLFLFMLVCKELPKRRRTNKKSALKGRSDILNNVVVR